MSRSASASFEACREAALRLLDRRAHSAAELRRKLRARRFSVGIADRVLDDLRAAGLLDDLAFARSYCEYRRSGGRTVGRLRVVSELHKRGLADEIIGQALRETWDAESDAAAEIDRAMEVGLKKWHTLRGQSDVQRATGKIYRFLAGRGFAADVCTRVIDRLRRDDASE